MRFMPFSHCQVENKTKVEQPVRAQKATAKTKVEPIIENPKKKDWENGHKNNMVAKHSRDARRGKETQTAILEKENKNLTELKKGKCKQKADLLPYQKLDLNAKPFIIAKNMVEGVNIPGVGKPILVDSSSLPQGWENMFTSLQMLV